MDKHQRGISLSWLSCPCAAACIHHGGCGGEEGVKPPTRCPPLTGAPCRRRRADAPALNGESPSGRRGRDAGGLHGERTEEAQRRGSAAIWIPWIRHGKRGEGQGGTHGMTAGSGDFATIDAGFFFFFFRDRGRRKRPPLSGAEEESGWEPLSAQVRSDPHQVGAQRNRLADFCFFFFSFFKQTFPFTHHF